MNRSLTIEIPEDDFIRMEERFSDLGFSLNEGLKRVLVKISREPEFSEMLRVPNAETIAALNDNELFDAEDVDDLLRKCLG